MTPIGYAHLVERLGLVVRPLQRPAAVSTSVNRRVNAEDKVLFPTGVAIDDTPVGHLEFAVRHEGINLEVIDAAFERIPQADLMAHWRATPNGEHIRRLCFLWEWLKGQELPGGVTPGGGYVDLFPADEYVTAPAPQRSQKFRVRDNALGNRDFCPMVRRQALPSSPGIEHLLAEMARTLDAVANRELYDRVIQYLYLSETQGSYAIERETPSVNRQERFVQLLRNAGAHTAVDEAWLVELQNAAVREAYSQEASYRTRQNWLENSAGRITFFPPSSEEMRRAMAGWETFANDDTRCPDVLVKAACTSFGFVYLHPFMDGNGRLHRFLIHHVLARSGLLPPGTILPASAVMLKHLPEYHAVLSAFSQPVTALWDYRRADGAPIILRCAGSRSYRFFQADREVAFVHDMIRLAVQEEIPRELAWLQGYDEAFARLDQELDLPQKDLAALIRMAHSNRGTLSSNRRRQYAHLPEAVLNRIEAVVRQTFSWHQ